MSQRARRNKRIRLAGGREYTPCHYCWQPLRFTEITLDHKLARSRGGRATRDNLVACCEQCNQAKADIPYVLFLEAMRPVREARQRGEKIPWVFAKPSDKLIEAWSEQKFLEKQNGKDGSIQSSQSSAPNGG